MSLTTTTPKPTQNRRTSAVGGDETRERKDYGRVDAATGIVLECLCQWNLTCFTYSTCTEDDMRQIVNAILKAIGVFAK